MNLLCITMPCTTAGWFYSEAKMLEKRDGIVYSRADVDGANEIG